VNNHIHTTYSFSPYSPTAAVFFARAAGLCTCGLMDHDSIAGAEEFLAAAKAAHMGATIGMECRASFADTPFADKKLNNPDQKGVVYMALHGVPHDRAAGLNALYAIERLPLMLAILIHGGALYLAYLGTYLVNGWLEEGALPIIIFSAIFAAGYFVIWAAVYVIVKRSTARINRALAQKQKSNFEK
jgi:hypothetical protein